MSAGRHEGLVELLGIEEESPEPGVVLCRLAVDERHRNIQGVIHGSVTMALLDTAMGHALSGTLEAGKFCSTMQISFQFVRAARAGERLEATGRVTHRGRRVAYLEGACTNAKGELVARAQGSWYVGDVR